MERENLPARLSNAPNQSRFGATRNEGGNSLAARKKGIPTLSFSAPPLTDFFLYEALPERLDWEGDGSYPL